MTWGGSDWGGDREDDLGKHILIISGGGGGGDDE